MTDHQCSLIKDLDQEGSQSYMTAKSVSALSTSLLQTPAEGPLELEPIGGVLETARPVRVAVEFALLLAAYCSNVGERINPRFGCAAGNSGHAARRGQRHRHVFNCPINYARQWKQTDAQTAVELCLTTARRATGNGTQLCKRMMSEAVGMTECGHF